jgi:hypothetical protein
MVKFSLSKDGKKLIVEADIESPKPGSSGKTLVVASTSGNKGTGIEIDVPGVGKREITVGLNAYVYPTAK